MLDVTVAVCTWNRARLLDQTLQKMRSLDVPPTARWELLVVNNNCTDDTDAVIARHAGALPLRRLLEPKQGHCNARNCAIDAARGELVIWTDDDVLVHPNWVRAYLEAAQRWPQATYFGGETRPWYEVPPAAWIDRNREVLAGMLLLCQRGRVERPLEGEEFCVGANMAYRRRVFEQFRFDPQLGLCGDNAVRGDEVAFQMQLRQAGHVGVFVPGAVVEHFLERRRLTRRFMWDYYSGQGRTEILRGGIPAGTPWRGAPRWLVRQMWTTWCAAWLRRLSRQSAWVAQYKRAARLHGMVAECRRPRRDRSADSMSPEPAK